MATTPAREHQQAPIDNSPACTLQLFLKELCLASLDQGGAFLPAFFIEVFIFVYAVGWLSLAADKTCGAMEAACSRAKLRPDVAGATLMAFGGCAPEVCINIICTWKQFEHNAFMRKNRERQSSIASFSEESHDTHLGIGSCLGSGMIAFAVIPALCVFFSQKNILKLKLTSTARDTAAYLLALLYLLHLLLRPQDAEDGSVLLTKTRALGFFGIYFFYIIVVWCGPQLWEFFLKDENNSVAEQAPSSLEQVEEHSITSPHNDRSRVESPNRKGSPTNSRIRSTMKRSPAKGSPAHSSATKSPNSPIMARGSGLKGSRASGESLCLSPGRPRGLKNAKLTRLLAKATHIARILWLPARKITDLLCVDCSIKPLPRQVNGEEDPHEDGDEEPMTERFEQSLATKVGKNVQGPDDMNEERATAEKFTKNKTFIQAVDIVPSSLAVDGKPEEPTAVVVRSSASSSLRTDGISSSSDDLKVVDDNSHMWPLTFAAALTITFCNSFVVTNTVNRLVYLLGLPADDLGFVGVVVLGFSAEVVDMAQSGQASRRGLGDLAISSCLGSQTLNVCLGLGGPWLVAASLGQPLKLKHTHSLVPLACLVLFLVLLVSVNAVRAFSFSSSGLNNLAGKERRASDLVGEKTFLKREEEDDEKMVKKIGKEEQSGSTPKEDERRTTASGGEAGKAEGASKQTPRRNVGPIITAALQRTSQVVQSARRKGHRHHAYQTVAEPNSSGSDLENLVYLEQLQNSNDNPEQQPKLTLNRAYAVASLWIYGIAFTMTLVLAEFHSNYSATASGGSSGGSGSRRRLLEKAVIRMPGPGG